jgi:hypothetical protein
MSIEFIGVLFMSLMFGQLVWAIQKRLERQPKKTVIELWVHQYQKDVPTVWTEDFPDDVVRKIHEY